MPAWTETGKNADGMELNQYFVKHPEMILGTMQEVTTQYGKDTACVPDPNVELEAWTFFTSVTRMCSSRTRSLGRCVPIEHARTACTRNR